MAAGRKVTNKKTARRKAAKRELIDTGSNRLYVRRNARGTSFKEVETWAGRWPTLEQLAVDNEAPLGHLKEQCPARPTRQSLLRIFKLAATKMELGGTAGADDARRMVVGVAESSEDVLEASSQRGDRLAPASLFIVALVSLATLGDGLGLAAPILSDQAASPILVAASHRKDGHADGVCEVVQPREGFDFIAPYDGGKDLFVHVSAVERAGLMEIVEGQKTTYDVGEERGRPTAQNIKVS